MPAATRAASPSGAHQRCCRVPCSTPERGDADEIEIGRIDSDRQQYPAVAPPARPRPAERHGDQRQQYGGYRGGKPPLQFRPVFGLVRPQELRGRGRFRPVADRVRHQRGCPDGKGAEPADQVLVVDGLPVDDGIVEFQPVRIRFRVCLKPSPGSGNHLQPGLVAGAHEQAGEFPGSGIPRFEKHRAAFVAVQVKPSGCDVFQVRGCLGAGAKLVEPLIGPWADKEREQAHDHRHRQREPHDRCDDAPLADAAGLQGGDLEIRVQAAQGNDHADVQGDGNQHLEGDQHLEPGQRRYRRSAQHALVCVGEKAR